MIAKSERDGPNTLTSPASFRDQAITGLWQDFQGPALESIGVLDEAAMSLLRGDMEEGLRSRAYVVAHKLVETFAVLELKDGAQLARNLEQLLGREAALGPAECLQVSDVALALRLMLEQGPRPNRVRPLFEPSAIAILVIEAQRDLGHRLVLEATAVGIEATAAMGLTTSRTAISRRLPDLIFLDPALAEGRIAVLEFIHDFVTENPKVPVVIVASQVSLKDRLEFVHAGARYILQKPLSSEQAIDVVQTVLEASEPHTIHSMAISDDLRFLESVTQVLLPYEIKCQHVTAPLSCWDAMEASEPDFLIIDAQMRGCSALDLCRALRSDLELSVPPIMVLSAAIEHEARGAFLLAGAEEYLLKDDLASKIMSHVRHRGRGPGLSLDESFTNAESRRFIGKFDAPAQPRKERNLTLCLALINVDGLDRITETHGIGVAARAHRCLGKILSEKFGGDNVLTRWRGDEYIVAASAFSRPEALGTIASVVQEMHSREFPISLGSLRATVSVGVAQKGLDGADFASMYVSAAEALSLARESGGDRVVPAGLIAQNCPQTTTLDVLLVDDDVIIGRVLMHALEKRGYRAQWLRNGLTALEQLSRNLTPRLLVLDANLPGLDGLSLLRQIRESGGLAQTRVIMVTARSAEAEILKALEWGAFDHVSKPFSLPVLMQRIRLALEG